MRFCIIYLDLFGVNTISSYSNNCLNKKVKNMKCENCGNEHDGSYGSGRFCSAHCRRVWSGRHSAHNGNHKCNLPKSKKSKKSKFGTWKCKRCNLIFETRAQLFQHNHEFHPIVKGSSWNKGLTKDTDERIAAYVQTCKDRNHYVSFYKGKHISEEHRRKTSESMKKFFREHPDRVPYLLNHSSKESYPEQYFRTAFQNENFPSFVQDKYVEGYFLDFAFENSKQYIEVDGEQHYTDQKIVEHDKIRYEILNKTEWKCICRIRWSKFQKLNEQQKHAFIIGLKRKII